MQSAQVHKMEDKKAPAVREETAIGTSLNINLGQGRALVLQTHVGLSDDIDSVLDRLLSAADRQKAKYEIVEIQDELRRMKLMQDDRRKQIETMKDHPDLKMLDEEAAKLQHQHEANGRKSDFKLPQSYLQRRKAVEDKVASNLKTAEIELARHEHEAARLEHEIEKRKKIVGKISEG